MTCKTDVERIHKNFILWLKINFSENKTLHTESTDYGTEYSNKKKCWEFLHGIQYQSTCSDNPQQKPY